MDPTQEYIDRDGARIGVQSYPEPGLADAPAVMIWPAMGVPARFYRPFAEQLVAAGTAVHVVDLRGTGASSPRPDRSSRYGYPELAADVGAVRDWLAPRIAGRRTVLLGHSLGAHVCLLHLALDGGSGVSGMVVVAAGLAYWRTYPGARGLLTLAQTQTVATTTALLGVWPGWGFGGRQSRGVIRDWAYTARHGRYQPVAGTDPEPALAALRVPVLAVSVAGDDYVPPFSLDHLCGKLVSAPVERVHYTGETGARLNHFAWARTEGSLARRVADFASRH
ncbi:Predicted alpha/beta hydrolase [Micromonospora pattaloongensis]|uniref:Predicted alpha/beta hydrolase n=1 Tax=Micromonospora pattaloongensis TaxID=405436 RepID=A0A1H3R2C1_9ACTN|nr:alpha/beta fold hydrolase [Micromonospora pattaloongensis]SDZ19746.1 Predicted alpha/beta hydrolase [Micromonospora pattaloongensis]